MLVISIKGRRGKIGLSHLARRRSRDGSDEAYYKEEARIRAYEARLPATSSEIVTPFGFLSVYRCKSGRANLIPVKQSVEIVPVLLLGRIVGEKIILIL